MQTFFSLFPSDGGGWGGGRFLCQNIFNAHICNLRIEGSMYIIGLYSVFFQRINISKIKYIASGAIWTDKLENKIFLIILCHNTEIIFQSSISDMRFRDIHNMRLQALFSLHFALNWKNCRGAGPNVILTVIAQNLINVIFCKIHFFDK